MVAAIADLFWLSDEQWAVIEPFVPDPASDRLATLAHDRGNFGDSEPLLGREQDHLRTRANPDIARRSVELVKLAQLIDVQAVQTQGAHRRLPA
jgi:hypothetical protein